MTASWMMYVLLVGILLALGARAVGGALALSEYSTRWTWVIALVGIAVLAAVAPRERSLQFANEATITPMEAPAAVHDDSDDQGIIAGLKAVRTEIASLSVRAIAATNVRVPATAARTVAIGWAFASALLLTIYLLVNLHLARVRHRWPLARVQGTTVRVAPMAGPAVIGMIRAEIVVPRSLLARSDDEQRLIIQHEDEHLRAHDHVLLALACLMVIVLPWHPAVWYILTRLRLAIELDCDARVLRRGAPPHSYGALLIDMAAHGTGLRVGTLALADRPSHLERRLLAMNATRSRFVLARVGALCASAGLLLMAACEARIPTSAELTSMDVAGAEKAMASSGAFSDSRWSNADYFLDGTKMTRDELMKLDGRDVGSITIVKGKVPGGRDTIFVVSRERMPMLDSLGERGTKVRRAGTVTVGHGGGMIAKALSDPNAKPAIMIDGKISSESALAAVRQDDIVSVSVMKPTKELVAGDPYPNGLLAVETKMNASSRSKVRAPRGSEAPDPFASVEVRAAQRAEDREKKQ